MYKSRASQGLTIAKEEESSREAVKYGLLANKNSLLFTKLPNSLFSSTPQTPPSSPVEGSFSNAVQCCSSTQHNLSGHSTQEANRKPSTASTISSSSSFLSLRSWTSNTTKGSSIFSSFSASTPTVNVVPASCTKSKPKTSSFSVKPANLGGNPLCPNQLAILDLVTYYDVVNMCVSARTSPIVKIDHSNVTYTDSLARSSFHSTKASNRLHASTSTCAHQQLSSAAEPNADAISSRRKNTRRIRKFVMSKDVSLNCFERKFLHKLMLECFESPFDDDFEYVAPQQSRRASAPSLMTSDSNSNITEHSRGSESTHLTSPEISQSISDQGEDKLSIDDACLHVELVHSVDHGNLHALLTNILNSSNAPDSPSSASKQPLQQSHSDTSSSSPWVASIHPNYSNPSSTMTLTQAKKKQMYDTYINSASSSKKSSSPNKSSLRYQSFDEALLSSTNSGSPALGKTACMQPTTPLATQTLNIAPATAGLKASRSNMWGKRIAIF